MKDDLDNPEVVAVLKSNYRLTDDAIAFIGKSADTFSIGTLTDTLKEIIDTLKGAGIIEQIENVDVPNVTLGYGV